MKIKQIVIPIVLSIACLSGQGDYLGTMRGKTLNTEERVKIAPRTDAHNCYSELRPIPNTNITELLELFGPGSKFEELEKTSLTQLIQQLGTNLKGSCENHIRLWVIRERINDSIEADTLKSICNFKNFYVTWKDLLGAIKATKQYADRQPGGSDAVKLCDSFRSVPSSEYAKILADMLKNSPGTWKFQPVVPAEEPANPFDEKPSATSDIPPSSYEEATRVSANPFAVQPRDMLQQSPATRKAQHVFPAEEPAILVRNPFNEKPSSTPNMPPPSYKEATGVSARKNATNPSTSGVQPTNYFPQQPGDISAWTALQAGAVANSARDRQDLISEMVTKFPLEDVLKGDKSTLEDFKSHLKTLPGYYLSKEDEYMGLPKDLTDFLNPLGYRAVATPGVGNCAFDAVLLSLLYEMGIYRPEYNSVLGTYLEKQMPKFRSEVAKDVKDMSLSKEIATINHPVDNEVFSVLAFKFNRKILLVTPYSKSEVIIQCYLPQGMVISPNGQTNEAFFDSLKKDALLISFNGVNHYVALLDKNNSKQ